MTPKQIARKFLHWFETDAPIDAELVYAPGTDFVERYRTDAHGIVNAMDHVRSLSTSRLDAGDAEEVIAEAQKLLRPNN